MCFSHVYKYFWTSTCIFRTCTSQLPSLSTCVFTHLQISLSHVNVCFYTSTCIFVRLQAHTRVFLNVYNVLSVYVYVCFCVSTNMSTNTLANVYSQSSSVVFSQLCSLQEHTVSSTLARRGDLNLSETCWSRSIVYHFWLWRRDIGIGQYHVGNIRTPTQSEVMSKPNAEIERVETGQSG